MQEPEGVLSLVWVSDKVGAAYFDGETGELQLLPDCVDYASHNFWLIKTLFRNVNPKYVIISARQDPRVTEILKGLCEDTSRENLDAGSDLEGDERMERRKLMVLQVKDFSPDACKARLQKQRFPEEGRSGETEHRIFINSMIPFDNPLMVRAGGALLKLLDKTCHELLDIDLWNGMVPVVNIKLICMNDVVAVDSSSWTSLQIFTMDNNPNNRNMGGKKAGKEEMSIFSLLDKCVTRAGSKCLKSFLVHPTRNTMTLNRRLDVIEYAVSPANVDFVRSAKQCLKEVKSIPKLLITMQAKSDQWKDLFKTLNSFLLLIDLVSYQSQRISLFAELSEPQRKYGIKKLRDEIARVIDFEESKRYNRFVPNAGLDEQLDSNRKQYKCLPDIMTIVAREEIVGMPSHIDTCTISYIPEVGFLLAIQFWEDNLTGDDLQIHGWDYKSHTMMMVRCVFQFSCNNVAYYKSDRSKELDVALGDCILPIIQTETSLMIALTEQVYQSKAVLLNLYNLVAELDCLLGLATVSATHDFVRPSFSHDHVLAIENGYHPLVKIRMEAVPNTTVMNEEEKVIILTGPNASGKSVYLKQVGVIAIMALSGSFVPATSARIPLFDHIFTIIQSVESVSHAASTFQQDISHLSIALKSYTENSLLIIDEFGKGTAETDGISLLVSWMEHLLNLSERCPLVFLSTHFHSVRQYLGPNPMYKMKTFRFLETEDSVVFLYTLIDGYSGSSFAFNAAHAYGLQNSVLVRARKIYEVVHDQLDDVNITRMENNSEDVCEARMALLRVTELVDRENVDETAREEKLGLIYDIKRVLKL